MDTFNEIFTSLPVLAIKLVLPVEAMEEEHITTALMMEDIFTEEGSIRVRVSELMEGGLMKGHLVAENTGKIVYKNLVKEGIIKFM